MAVTDALVEDDVIRLIRGGATQDEIAQKAGISAGSLNNWLHESDERSARARAAMRQSAESWLDRGLAALQDAERDPSEIARARAIEQHCARRAAIRDPHRYSDRTTTTHEGALSLSVGVAATTLTDDQLAAIAAGHGKA